MAQPQTNIIEKLLLVSLPTKMCIYSAPYLYQKMIIEYQISIKFNANLTQKAPKKVHNLHHCIKMMQIRRQKGASTKMQKCLVWMQIYQSIRIKKLELTNHDQHSVICSHKIRQEVDVSIILFSILMPNFRTQTIDIEKRLQKKVIYMEHTL